MAAVIKLYCLMWTVYCSIWGPRLLGNYCTASFLELLFTVLLAGVWSGMKCAATEDTALHVSE